MIFANNSMALASGCVTTVMRHTAGFEKSMSPGDFILLLLIGGYCKHLKSAKLLSALEWGLAVGEGEAGVARCLETPPSQCFSGSCFNNLKNEMHGP